MLNFIDNLDTLLKFQRMKEESDWLMLEAIKEAEKAIIEDEVPVGAVIAFENKIIARAHNLVEKHKDATQHAEIIAIKKASEIIGDWRLNNCILCVTLEPCAMCIGAIKLSRIEKVVFGAHDPIKGCCGSILNLSENKNLGPNFEMISGVMAEKCGQLLKDFFKGKRANS